MTVHFVVDSDVESCVSCVLVSLLCLARSRLFVIRKCVLNCLCVCVEPQNVSFWAHRKQCVQLTAQSFSAVSKGVEQENHPEMSSGSWQDMAQLVCQQRLLG